MEIVLRDTLSQLASLPEYRGKILEVGPFLLCCAALQRLPLSPRVYRLNLSRMNAMNGRTSYIPRLTFHE